MPRHSKPLECTPEQIEHLQSIIRSWTSEQRMVERAQIVLACMGDHRVDQVAKELGLNVSTVYKWRERFRQYGMDGLEDSHRSGRPILYGKETGDKILAKLEETPPVGLARWDGPTLAKALNIPAGAVWRFTRKNNIQLDRQRSWCVSHDPDFERKAADVIGLYLNPPEDAIVFSVDEKPIIQAIERAKGYVRDSNGKLVRGLKSRYTRHGTLNLTAALEVATGKVFGKTTLTKTRVDFLGFMDDLLASLPPVNKIYHVIIDNYCTHKHCDEWLKDHPNVVFHYTPTSASWLNMIEIWNNIFSRKVLKGASFEDLKALEDAIEKFIKAYNRDDPHPFIWRKREVKGCELKNTLANLKN